MRRWCRPDRVRAVRLVQSSKATEPSARGRAGPERPLQRGDRRRSGQRHPVAERCCPTTVTGVASALRCSAPVEGDQRQPPRGAAGVPAIGSARSSKL